MQETRANALPDQSPTVKARPLPFGEPLRTGFFCTKTRPPALHLDFCHLQTLFRQEVGMAPAHVTTSTCVEMR